MLRGQQSLTYLFDETIRLEPVILMKAPYHPSLELSFAAITKFAPVRWSLANLSDAAPLTVGGLAIELEYKAISMDWNQVVTPNTY